MIHNNNNKEYYKAIYFDTLEQCNRLNLNHVSSVKYNYDSKEFNDNKILATITTNTYRPLVLVDNIDSFDMAINMKSNNIMVLNLASFLSSGGGVTNGCKAQEEDLYRKSNYAFVNNNNFYPLAMNECVYSPLVYIIKDSNYNLLKTPIAVSCLAMAGIKNPQLKLTSNKTITYNRSLDRERMKQKIDMIFKVAIYCGHTDLVLGALGCGVYNNPIKEVATMFKQSILKYGKYFKRIGFAILCGDDDTNIRIFKRVLSN